MQKTVLVFVALLVVAPLAGCADESDGAGDPTATTTTTVTEVPSPTSTPTVTPTVGSPTPTTTPDPTTISTPTPTTTLTPTATDSADESPIEGGDVRTATVTRVVDGDTVEVEFSDGTEDTIRLLGVDTPETIASNQDPSDFEGIPDTAEGRDWLLNWGHEANDYARGQLAGEQVQVVMDPDSDRRGSYGRLLAYIYVDGSNFNQLLLEQGLARVYDSSFSLRTGFYQVEETAQRDDRGLWAFEGSAAGEPTSEPTQSSGDLDCSDFDTQQEAQEFFEAHDPDADPHRLDGNDNDGNVCESLP